MSYEILGHTADVRLKVSGKNLEELFQSALAGMTEIMQPKISSRGETSIEKISLDARDSTILLINFLSECLTLSHINKVFYQAKFSALTETKLDVELDGMAIENFERDIKAVTFHEVEVRKNENGEFETNVIFDI